VIEAGKFLDTMIKSVAQYGMRDPVLYQWWHMGFLKKS